MAVVTESFLPLVNGVTNSVLRACEHLTARGHEVLVVAPAGPRGSTPLVCAGAAVVPLPAAALPGYPEVRVARPTTVLEPLLADFAPDVVHLAGPLVLGAAGAAAARRLQLPTVAVYQTDLAAYAARYGFGATGSRVVWRWLRRVHESADVTLAPSTAALADLHAHGVDNAVLWPRGVDLRRFSPRHRDAGLRARLAPGGEVLVGYVGRLAAEKELDLLTAVADLPGTRLLVVGDGPQRAALQRRLPTAAFLGLQHGAALSRAVASLDVFVHPGRSETFCQAVQEALASGVPVVGVASGGLLDLVEPGRNGTLFTPGDAAGLRAGVQTLAADDLARARLGRRARAGVRGRSWERVFDALLAHYAAAGADVGTRRQDVA